MKKEFYFSTNFNGSFELPYKKYPHLEDINEVNKLISRLKERGYKINIKQCYANFDETSEVPFNQAKTISQDEELKSIVIKGDNLEIMVKNESSGSGLIGGSFSQGIAGYVSIKNAKTKEELGKVEKLIEKNWHVENKENIATEQIKFKKRRRLSDFKFRGYKL